MDLMLDHLTKGMMLSLLLSMPAVLLAAALGLVVGILQAVTQVQEQTIAAAPKILGVFMLLIFGGGLMLKALNEYTIESFHIGMEEVTKDGPFVLAPTPQTPTEIRADQFYESTADSHPLPKRFENLKPR